MERPLATAPQFRSFALNVLLVQLGVNSLTLVDELTTA